MSYGRRQKAAIYCYYYFYYCYYHLQDRRCVGEQSAASRWPVSFGEQMSWPLWCHWVAVSRCSWGTSGRLLCGATSWAERVVEGERERFVARWRRQEESGRKKVCRWKVCVRRGSKESVWRRTSNKQTHEWGHSRRAHIWQRAAVSCQLPALCLGHLLARARRSTGPNGKKRKVQSVACLQTVAGDLSLLLLPSTWLHQRFWAHSLPLSHKCPEEKSPLIWRPIRLISSHPVRCSPQSLSPSVLLQHPDQWPAAHWTAAAD